MSRESRGSVRALPPRRGSLPNLAEDPSLLGSYLDDASGAPAGRTPMVARPVDEAEASAFLGRSDSPGRTGPILFQAARTSLTGGAIPRGERVLSVEKMERIGTVERSGPEARVRVEPGVRLDRLREELAGRGWYYPPVPTYEQAMIGGTVATNAGGAATFKYGVTRQWVAGLRVVLSDGSLLELERGQCVAERGDRFRIERPSGEPMEVPVTSHRLPDLKKISAGYHASDPLDLVDLFIGSEGTLGLISEITLRLVPLPAAWLIGIAFPVDRKSALGLAAELRECGQRAWREPDAGDPDIRAIEWIDRQGLDLMRRHGDAARLQVALPPDAGSAVLFEMELDRPLGEEQLVRALESAGPEAAAAGDRRDPLDRLCRTLARHRLLDRCELALPTDPSRRTALKEFREAVPRRVNELLAGRRAADGAVRKVGGDLIVPFDRLGAMMTLCEERFERSGLDHAIWGHLSDGNLHPNVIARSGAEVERGEALLLEFAREATARGGCPLSEHGVGRHPLKQQLLREFVGPDAIERMQRIKSVLDPTWRLAPGVLFPVRNPA